MNRIHTFRQNKQIFDKICNYESSTGSVKHMKEGFEKYINKIEDGYDREN